MGRLKRVLAITGGLIVVGAAAGALAGGVAAALIALGEGSLRAIFDFEWLTIGMGFGAQLGAVLLPVAGWLLMRRVPLGRALLGTILGAAVGGTLGYFLPLGDQLWRTIYGGVIGFALAVLVLRRRAALAAVGDNRQPV